VVELERKIPTHRALFALETGLLFSSIAIVPQDVRPEAPPGSEDAIAVDALGLAFSTASSQYRGHFARTIASSRVSSSIAVDGSRLRTSFYKSRKSQNGDQIGQLARCDQDNRKLKLIGEVTDNKNTMGWLIGKQLEKRQPGVRLPKPTGDDGVGLIEVMVAFLVFMACFLPLMMFLPSGSKVIVNSEDQRSATALVYSNLQNDQQSVFPGTTWYVGTSTQTWTAAAPTTLTAALTAGQAGVTTLAVTPLLVAITAGEAVTIGSGAAVQSVTASSADAVGATSVGVTSFTSTYAQPIGTSVFPQNGAGNTTVPGVTTTTATQGGVTFRIYTEGGWCVANGSPAGFGNGTVGSATPPSYHVVIKVGWGPGISMSQVHKNVVVDSTELSSVSGVPTSGAVNSCPLGLT